MGVLFIRVPYYIGDLKGDADLEKYPHQWAFLAWVRVQTRPTVPRFTERTAVAEGSLNLKP